MTGDSMKKSTLAMIAVVVSFVVQADVLYWMVSDDYAATASENDTSTFATLYAVDGNNTKTPLDSRSGGDVWNAYQYDPAIAFHYNGIENYSTYSFFIELASNSYKTDTVTYQALSNYILKGGSGLPSSTFDSAGFGGGTTSYNVPEPTSGLLFLVGGMLLGLKRRRQQV